MTPTKRLHIHFPGFEPLSAEQHYKRYVRGCESASKLWGDDFQISQFDSAANAFDIKARGNRWGTDTDCVIMDYSDFVKDYQSAPIPKRYITGFSAFFTVIMSGGFFAYMRHAWRFGLFFLFPFLFTVVGVAACFAIAILPIYYLSWFAAIGSIPAAIGAFTYAFRPMSNHLFIDLLMHDWAFAVSMARLDKPDQVAKLDELAKSVLDRRYDQYDEIMVTSHSMGGAVGTHVMGLAIQASPNFTKNVPIVFTQLGAAILQVGLLRSASVLRDRAAALSRIENLSWLEVQCLTDPMNFYKTNPLETLGIHIPTSRYHQIRIRVRALLSAQTYAKIKRDFLRVHRQFVMSAEQKAAYDFIPLVAGPSKPIEFLKRNDIETLKVTDEDT